MNKSVRGLICCILVFVFTLINAGCSHNIEQPKMSPSTESSFEAAGAIVEEGIVETQSEPAGSSQNSLDVDATTIGSEETNSTLFDAININQEKESDTIQTTAPTPKSTNPSETPTIAPASQPTKYSEETTKSQTVTQPTKTPVETTKPTETIPPTTKPSSSGKPNKCKHKNATKATCVNVGYCSDCNTIVEEINPSAHPKGQEPGLYNEKAATCAEEGYTGDLKCLSCYAIITPGKTIPKLSNHSGGTASCSAQAICVQCGASYGNYNKNNHTRANGTTNWERRNEVQANCSNGYSGDLYCLDCGSLITKGEVIPAMGCMDYDAVPATCCSYSYCSRCGNVWDWMGYDYSNHVGGTEVRNQVPATYPCSKGYSGDTYCLGCNSILSYGYENGPSQDHNYQEISREQTDTSITITSQCSYCGTTSTISISVG